MPANKPIIVLGAGINGAAISRELLLNGWSVYLVDQADLASGSTAYSSRLIHGGLRYLEYGEFSLVRESIEERQRLLQCAPHLVEPLRLFIPVVNRTGGLWQSTRRFLHLPAFGSGKTVSRGLWLVRLGLQLYDWYCRSPSIPDYEVHKLGQAQTPPVNSQLYRWLCSYWDAQIQFPERFVVALLKDAQRLADQADVDFRLFTYHQASLEDRTVTIRPVAANSPDKQAAPTVVEAAAVVNATGAWVDRTLNALDVPATRLIGGTKGSHFLTANRVLRESLDSAGIYTEASDGRPVFLLPFGDLTLVGTTDLPFERDPSEAVATQQELDYLIDAVNAVFPSAQLSATELELHYCGVRPLPYVMKGSTASITRRHFYREHEQSPIPLMSIIGGKLTTCRSLAEETVARLLEMLGTAPHTDSRQRPLPGGEHFPSTAEQVVEEQQSWARDAGFSIEQVQAIWNLGGRYARNQLLDTSHAESPIGGNSESLCDTDLPVRFVQHVIRDEWVTHLSDLVERRLMLLYKQNLSIHLLRQLAKLMVQEDMLAIESLEDEVNACSRRLQSHFGKRLVVSE